MLPTFLCAQHGNSPIRHQHLFKAYGSWSFRYRTHNAELMQCHIVTGRELPKKEPLNETKCVRLFTRFGPGAFNVSFLEEASSRCFAPRSPAHGHGPRRNPARANRYVDHLAHSTFHVLNREPAFAVWPSVLRALARQRGALAVCDPSSITAKSAAARNAVIFQFDASKCDSIALGNSGERLMGEYGRQKFSDRH